MFHLESSDLIPELLAVIDWFNDLILCLISYLVAWGLNWFFKLNLGQYGIRVT